MAKQQPRSLSGEVVVITGGARGIGKATAKALIAKGAKIVIGDLDLELAQKTAKELGNDTLALHLDVTDVEAFTAFLDEVEKQREHIDVLINNAGIMPLGPLDLETDSTTVRQLEINLHAVIHGTKEAMRRMKPRGKGHIVNVASMAGKGGFPHGATYCATKFAVVGLSQAVKAELRGTGVEVSVVMPGVVNTELASGLPSARGVKNSEPEDVADEIVKALQVPKFEVFVPPMLAGIARMTALLPTRGAEALAKALKGDQVLASADHNARAAYEARAAKSAPHAIDQVEAEKVLKEAAAAGEREPATTT